MLNGTQSNGKKGYASSKENVMDWFIRVILRNNPLLAGIFGCTIGLLICTLAQILIWHLQGRL